MPRAGARVPPGPKFGKAGTLGAIRGETMREVLLDTTVYRADPRRATAAFESLSASCRGGVVRLHVPFVVQHEFLSSRQAQVREKLRAARTAIGGLHREASDPDLVSQARRLESEIESLGNRLVEEVRAEFVKWLEVNRAIIHPVADAHGQRVLVRYFSGEPPFRAPKSREDFPDAFIAALIEDLTSRGTELHVVSGDYQLRASVARHESVLLYKDLDDMMAALASGGDTGCLEGHMHRAAGMIQYIEGDLGADLADALSAMLVDANAVMSLDGKTFNCRISYVDTVFGVTLEDQGFKHLGGGVCVVPFKARAHAGIMYSIDRDVYDDLSEQATDELMVVLEDEQHFGVAEERGAMVGGVLRTVMDYERMEEEWLSQGELRDILRTAWKTLDRATVIAIDPKPRGADGTDGA